MTKEESGWLTGLSPARLLYHVEQLRQLTGRKKRLFACGCYRLIWDRFSLPSIREAVEMTEGRADRKVRQAALMKYRYPAGDPPAGSVDERLRYSVHSLITPGLTPVHVAWMVRSAVEPERYEQASKWADCPPQADLVRDLFGNPFRPVAFDPEWRTAAAVGVARSMYEARDFAPMPVLADALDDAGCDHPEVLAHCRDPQGVHVRGCWVVDGVLGLA